MPQTVPTQEGGRGGSAKNPPKALQVRLVEGITGRLVAAFEYSPDESATAHNLRGRLAFFLQQKADEYNEELAKALGINDPQCSWR